MKTAITILIERLKKNGLNKDFIENEINGLLEIEENQIKSAYATGTVDGADYVNNVGVDEKDVPTPENYFNKTFKK